MHLQIETKHCQDLYYDTKKFDRLSSVEEYLVGLKHWKSF